jgi:hypothetical protein
VLEISSVAQEVRLYALGLHKENQALQEENREDVQALESVAAEFRQVEPLVRELAEVLASC